MKIIKFLNAFALEDENGKTIFIYVGKNLNLDKISDLNFNNVKISKSFERNLEILSKFKSNIFIDILEITKFEFKFKNEFISLKIMVDEKEQIEKFVLRVNKVIYPFKEIEDVINFLEELEFEPKNKKFNFNFKNISDRFWSLFEID